jgi:hypothetical protein
MPCIKFSISIPGIPDIFVTLPLVPNLPLPADFDFCCHFEIPDILGLNVAIAVVNAAVAAIGAEANAIAAMVEMEILAAAGPFLDQVITLSVSCPFD